jgi:tRNA threonylcarbamoyladenosine modification (KEOPS) complex  Pcc1 subunit
MVRGVPVSCRIEIEYPDERMARIILKAIEQDNAGYVVAEVEGATLILQASAETEPSMLHTLEDLLSCVKVAEDMVERSR